MSTYPHCKHCTWDHPAHAKAEAVGHSKPCSECTPTRGMHDVECDLLDLVESQS